MVAMKRLLYFAVFLFALALFSPPNLASAATCYANNGGNWNLTSTWTCGWVPGESDDAVIQGTSTVELTANPTNPVKSLKLVGDGALTMGGYTLTIRGTTGDALAFDRARTLNGTIQFESSGTRTVKAPDSAEATINNVNINGAQPCLYKTELGQHKNYWDSDN